MPLIALLPITPLHCYNTNFMGAFSGDESRYTRAVTGLALPVLSQDKSWHDGRLETFERSVMRLNEDLN